MSSSPFISILHANSVSCNSLPPFGALQLTSLHNISDLSSLNSQQQDSATFPHMKYWILYDSTQIMCIQIVDCC